MVTVEDQIAWEQECYQAGIKRFLASLERNRTADDGRTVYNESNSSYGTALLREVVVPLASDLAEMVATLGKPQRGRRNEGLVALREIDVEVAAYIASKTALDGITRARSLKSLAMLISTRIEDQIRMARFEDAAKGYYAAIRESQKKAHTTSYRHIRNSIVHCEKNVEGLDKWQKWSDRLKVLMGTVLVERFVVVTGLLEVLPPDANNDAYLVQPTEKAAEFIRQNVAEMRGMYPEWMPCLIAPRDWTDIDDGGFYTPSLFQRMPMVKTYSKEHRDLLKGNVKNMGRVFRALNALQRTAFRINPVVLGAIKDAFRDATCGMPGLAPIKPQPCPLTPEQIADFKEVSDAAREEYRTEHSKRAPNDWMESTLKERMTAQQFANREAFIKWKRQAAEAYTAEQLRRSRTIEVSRVLSVADKLTQLERFFYVYRCDSRGRVYAVGTAVNPQGSKEAKAMLEFANPERLGKDGYYWLLVHAANVFGKDKLPFSERTQWVRDNSDAIRAVVEGGSDWWQEADEPFEFLKCCHELVACWAHVAAVGREGFQSFRSRICPAMDGSCNGLQHYSMMLRDEVGARQVNLTNNASPEDIYKTVARRTMAAFESIVGGTPDLGTDATDENKELSRQWLDFGLDRNGAKRPVMVVPYAGTRISCLEYLRSWAIEKEAKEFADGSPFGVEKSTTGPDGKVSRKGGVGCACLFGSAVLWNAISATTPSARRGMTFIQGVGCSAARTPEGATQGIHWTVPGTGFIVHMAPKVQTESRVVTSLLGNARVRFSYKEDTEAVDVRAIRTGIAPNFVHSMDAGHLMLTICQAVDQGVTNFRVIHDSYGTTCADTTLLHRCIRSQFLGLHQREVLESFLMEQEERHPWVAEAITDKATKMTWHDYLLESYGSFNREEVRTSQYMFH